MASNFGPRLQRWVGLNPTIDVHEVRQSVVASRPWPTGKGICTPPVCNQATFVLNLCVKLSRADQSNQFMVCCEPLMSCLIVFHVKKNCNILCWNVWGLNATTRRDSVRNMISTSGATLVCLQEIKIANWTPRLVRDTPSPNFANNYTTLPAQGVGGGILLAANEHFFTLHTPTSRLTLYRLI
jgi:hypothetical protein